MRELSSAAVSALASGTADIMPLVSINLSTPVYASTMIDIGYNGVVYLQNTGLKSVPDITQDFVLSASSISIEFADPGNMIFGSAYYGGYHGARVDIHLAIINSDDYSLLHVINSIYRGYIDDVQPGTNGATTLTVKNHAYKFDRVAGRKTNTASQQRWYPADPTFDKITTTSGDWL
jgi:hypothetical protein